MVCGLPLSSVPPRERLSAWNAVPDLGARQEIVKTIATAPVRKMDKSTFGEGEVERTEVLTRYRRLKEFRLKHGNAIIKRLPKKTVLHWGKRIGLVRGKTFVASTMEEMTLVIDLAVYSTRSEKISPVERYRRSSKFAVGSEDDLMLDAMCRSFFSLFLVKRRHLAAGLILEDLLRQEEVWLMDEGLEQTASDGAVLASRATKPDAFHMTTGAPIPMIRDAIENVTAVHPFPDASLAGGATAEFVETVYRSAVSQGLMDTVVIE